MKKISPPPLRKKWCPCVVVAVGKFHLWKVRKRPFLPCPIMTANCEETTTVMSWFFNRTICWQYSFSSSRCIRATLSSLRHEVVVQPWRGCGEGDKSYCSRSSISNNRYWLTLHQISWPPGWVLRQHLDDVVAKLVWLEVPGEVCVVQCLHDPLSWPGIPLVGDGRCSNTVQTTVWWTERVKIFQQNIKSRMFFPGRQKVRLSFYGIWWHFQINSQADI